MPRNDEGEFELVLGNRQLLSGFFIVVVLFGVFFNLGYIVGRHSSPATASTAAAATPEAAASATSGPGSPGPGQAQVMPAEQPKPETLPPVPEAAKPETAPPKTAEHTQPVTATRPATAPPESPRPAEPKPVAPKPAAKPPVETKAAGSTIAEPAPGSYLQVAAPSRGAAGAVVESLKNKGIKALIAPGPNETTVRVLVGPLEAADVGKMRSELESAGFKPFSRKY
jgi:outer membrane biosynthesis protein TonB